MSETRPMFMVDLWVDDEWFFERGSFDVVEAVQHYNEAAANPQIADVRLRMGFGVDMTAGGGGSRLSSNTQIEMILAQKSQRAAA